MAGYIFEVTKRKDIGIGIAISAEIKDLGWKMKLYLDNLTGKPIYPAKVEKLIPGVTISLEPHDMVCCSLPPSIPEESIDMVIKYLGMVHDVSAAARKLIKEEQEKLNKSSDHNDDEKDIEDIDEERDEWLADNSNTHDVPVESWEIESCETESCKIESWEGESCETESCKIESWEGESCETKYWKLAEDMKKCIELIKCGRSDAEKSTAASNLKRHLKQCLLDETLSDLTAIYKDKRENNAIGYNPPAVALFVTRLRNRYPKP